MSDRNAFANSDLITLEELLLQVQNNNDLSFSRRREIASAMRALAAWTQIPLAMMPASATYLRERFERIHHDNIGVTKRRLQNVRSLIMAAFRAQGLSTQLAGYMETMNEDWQVLWSLIEDSTYFRTELSRLFRYCSKQKIQPVSLNDEVSEAYLKALEEEALVKKPRTRHQSVCRVWNKCCAMYADAGWPQVELTVPRYEERLYSIDPSLIPTSIRKELEDYLTYLSGSDPFTTHPSPFKPNSLNAVKGYFSRYLSALHHQGINLKKYSSLSDLVTPEMFKLAIRWFWDRNKGGTSKNLGELSWTIRSYAVKHLKADAETAAFYANAMKRLRIPQQGLSEKNRTAMAQFDDSAVVRKFANLPTALWTKAEGMKKTATSERITRKAQLLIQSAVAIEILTFAPMRISNLQGLRLDEHMSWMGKRLRISIPRQQVNNDQALEFLLPESVSLRVKDYLDRCRAALGDAGTPFLFPGRNGKSKDCSALRNQIRNTLWNEAGISLTPHQFRHTAAKVLLDSKPGYYEVVRKVLGHKSLSTTYSHYAGAETQAAITLYDQVIIEHRQAPIKARSALNQMPEPPFMDPLQFFGGRK